ncbi:MAG: hypothetical protein V4591_03870 [Bdellovibrionota bacterium]
MTQPGIRRVYACPSNAYSKLKPKKEKANLLFNAAYNNEYETTTQVINSIRSLDANNPLFISKNRWFGPNIPRSAQMLLAAAYIKEKKGAAFKDGKFDIAEFKNSLKKNNATKDIAKELKYSYFKNIKMGDAGIISLDSAGNDYCVSFFISSELENVIGSISDVEAKNNGNGVNNLLKEFSVLINEKKPENTEKVFRKFYELKKKHTELLETYNNSNMIKDQVAIAAIWNYFKVQIDELTFKFKLNYEQEFSQQVKKCEDFFKKISNIEDESPYLFYLKVEKLRKEPGNSEKNDARLGEIASKKIWDDKILSGLREAGADNLLPFVELVVSGKGTMYDVKKIRSDCKETFDYLKNNFRNNKGELDNEIFVDVLGVFISESEMSDSLGYALTTVFGMMDFIEKNKENAVDVVESARVRFSFRYPSVKLSQGNGPHTYHYAHSRL